MSIEAHAKHAMELNTYADNADISIRLKHHILMTEVWPILMAPSKSLDAAYTNIPCPSISARILFRRDQIRNSHCPNHATPMRSALYFEISTIADGELHQRAAEILRTGNHMRCEPFEEWCDHVGDFLGQGNGLFDVWFDCIVGIGSDGCRANREYIE
jgi:hypothetical protein